MNISVILSHPNPASFNHAIARTVCEAVSGAGHTLFFHDLHAEGFDPVMPTEELDRTDCLPPLVRQHTEELSVVDGIVLIHPNWWSAPPAMIAGWRDRCIRAGLAYRFESDGKGGGYSVGMFKARFALVINTLNTPITVEDQILGNPMLKHWKEIVFGLCGVKETSQKLIGPVITSTPEQRSQWLDEVRTLTLSKL
ncbi:MAG: NAD(P)H-dependent oxidoreductase [Verrucomicrobia bacterium]|nr:NAD(P)H-dependent oxidoreductase [Verrucomicrobiota bacterium]